MDWIGLDWMRLGGGLVRGGVDFLDIWILITGCGCGCVYGWKVEGGDGTYDM